MKKTETIRVSRDDDSGMVTMDILDALKRLGIDARISKESEDAMVLEVSVEVG